MAALDPTELVLFVFFPDVLGRVSGLSERPDVHRLPAIVVRLLVEEGVVRKDTPMIAAGFP